MNLTNSTSVDAAVSNASAGTAGNAAGLLVLRKALDAQEAGAAALIAALPQQPALATEGNLGRHVDTHA